MRASKTDKVVMKMADMLSDISLDLDEVGAVFAESQSTVMVNRLLLVAESAYDEKRGISNHVGLNQNANNHDI